MTAPVLESPSSPEVMIRLEGVQKTYVSREGAKHVAVSDATMTVNSGDLVSLVGPSGCGKTTLLKILADLHDADEGVIEIGTKEDP
ncbi:MAG: ATP-binding cassette domain-containing protein, partial [Alphaproteobacteria bacterium]